MKPRPPLPSCCRLLLALRRCWPRATPTSCKELQQLRAKVNELMKLKLKAQETQGAKPSRAAMGHDARPGAELNRIAVKAEAMEDSRRRRRA
jgi:hypothetical protein